MKNSYTSLVLIILFLYSCAPKVVKPLAVATPPIAAQPSENTSTNGDNIAFGKTIFENNCGKCHDLPDPKSNSAEKWVGIMNWMAPKAKLTDDEHKLVYDYLVSVK